MTQTATVNGFFPSLASLRIAHNELLVDHRQCGSTPDLLMEVADFIERGRATGAVLDEQDDRWAAQSLLDYWSAIIYRAGDEPPDATLAEFDSALAPELPDSLCPFVGLDAFSESDRDIFFGRERLAQTFIEKLRANRLLAVVGPSGSGKSSLVLAELIPSLKDGILPGSDRWRYLPRMVPGSDPLANLGRLIESTLLEQTDSAGDDSQQRLKCLLQDPTCLVRLANRSGDTPAVLVVDQFEEVFTLCTDDDVRDTFILQLTNFIETAGPRHTVILTMRTDFESFVARAPAFQQLFEQAVVRVTPLNAAELREAIELPAKKVGLKFEHGLIDALLQDILGEPAALPLLQFTLLKLWENRERNYITWDAYRTLGGGRLSLAFSADAFYDGLILEEQVTARRILLRLVRPGEGLEVTSNRVRRAALYKTGEARDRIDRVLRKLIAARLVRLTEGDITADAQVEVAHEALVRNWPRLVEWLEEEREVLRLRQRVTDSAQHWAILRRDPGALFPVTLLNEAQRVAKLSGIEFNELETEFIQASQHAIDAEHEREIARQVELRQAQLHAAKQSTSVKRLRVLAVILCLLLLVPLATVIKDIRQRRSPWQPIGNFPRNSVPALAAAYPEGEDSPGMYCAGTTDIGIGCSQGGETWNIYQQDLPTGEAANSGTSAYPGTVRGVQALAIDETNQRRIFAFFWDGIMYRSDSGGVRWHEASAGLPSGQTVVADAIASRDQLVFTILDHNLYVSTDGGEQWTPTGASSKPYWGRVYDVSIAETGDRAYAGTENGLYEGTLQEEWVWRRVAEIGSIHFIARKAGGDGALYLAASQGHSYRTELYLWQTDGSARPIATVDHPVFTMTADPYPHTDLAFFLLLDNGDVVAVTEQGNKRNLGQRPGWSWDTPMDLLAVRGPSDTDPTLMLGHTGGLLVYTQKIPTAPSSLLRISSVTN